MDTRIVHDLREIPASDWNRLQTAGIPFLQHEFLAALENHGCLGEDWGWFPRHLAVYENNQLVGASPMYIKTNSYGEFVFDWAWADAYDRHGLAYYPKLVSAIPYTPVTGPRLLVAPGANISRIKQELADAAMNLARDEQVSSLHWLFTDEADTRALQQQGFMLRTGCQFHWHNQGYRSFDDFLQTFSSKKRKNVRRERRLARENDVDIELLTGHDIDDDTWRQYHELYCSTFYRKSGYPTLSLDFFRDIGRTMPDNVLLIMARHADEYVAGAFNMRSDDALFGRHWGCSRHYDHLHFEICYYHAIEYCIQHGLQRFEAGAQGEHKISRGFVPVPTFSTHWLSHPAFSSAIADFLKREQQGMEHYMGVLSEHVPYKKTC
jgi:predicted N-acyltransferase